MSTTRVNLAALSVVVATAAAALVAGWWLFWFLCDDAFIAFRYVHNLVHGHGLVWNPAPFGPVEGYSSFLWVVLLAAVWTATGVAPPQSANWLLLLFSFGSLALIVRMLLSLSLSPRLAGWRLWLLALVLFGTLSNRTFLAWTSSGLEQGMFSCFLLGWVYVGLFWEPGRRQWLALGWISALLLLTRPDGLLFAAFTAAMILVGRFGDSRSPALQRSDAWLLVPFLVAPVHLLWRRAYYGEWLPNTYYAKHIAAWPEAGARYVASFALEYAYFLWLPLLLVMIVRWLWARPSPAPDPDDTGPTMRRLVLLALLGHFAYYSLAVGGDHFEYRVYHHLVPLLLVALVWLVDRCALGPGAALATIAGCISLGLVIPWTHWAATHELTELHQDGLPHVPIAERFPPAIQAWPRQFDRLQRWLQDPRSIGLRHQTHKLFVTRVQQPRFPDRGLGETLDFGGELPLMFHRAVGYPGWTMPQLMVLDGLGLNDAIIARNPVMSRRYRRMAHDRAPPPGYVQCLEPNVRVSEGRVTADERAQPLTDARVRECERRYREQVDALRRGDP